jgi:hypothetical protein
MADERLQPLYLQGNGRLCAADTLRGASKASPLCYQHKAAQQINVKRWEGHVIVARSVQIKAEAQKGATFTMINASPITTAVDRIGMRGGRRLWASKAL